MVPATYRDEAGTIYHGAVLANYGLLPDLPQGDYASTIVQLTRI